ncbi:tetratricopeptide repeat protein [Petrimonas sulfuriphila]|uniref:tetratricopeptide repeat protein n=1 Tax=Petrimonas sulfuriphila TaxID=285070 RepID=UPI003EB8A261
MRKISFYALLAGLVFAAASCSNLKPLSQSNFNATPSPLETVGNSVPVTVNGTFPEKWFNKNATVKITPVLKYAGTKESYGSAQTYQGENVSGNAIEIPYNRGGNFNMSFSFPYQTDMLTSELFMRFDAKIKNKSVKLPEVKVADGIVATSALASAPTTAPSVADDGFQRIIKQTQDANIHFVIQQANIRSSETNTQDMRSWQQRVQDAFNDPRQNVDIEISAYASPDGGLTLNERLAAQRERNTTQYLEGELKRRKIDTDVNARYTAQDWEGFRQLLEASDLQDKELVLRVLSMYPDPETREREIKNISFVYSDLASTILPQLRRSRITANIEIIGKSDEEIMEFWRANPKKLSVEELLYASTLTDNDADKEKIYQYVTVNFPQDYRGWNNMATAYYQRGEYNNAKQALDRAALVSPNAAEVNVNKALFAMMDGNTQSAKELLGRSSGANNLEAAMGLLYLMEGDYNQAVDAFGDTKSNNAALAQILTKNYNAADITLKAIKNPDALTYYLMAVIGSRTNNFNDVMTNLRSAITMDKTMAARALNDLEFAKYRTNQDFMTLLK